MLFFFFFGTWTSCPLSMVSFIGIRLTQNKKRCRSCNIMVFGRIFLTRSKGSCSIYVNRQARMGLLYAWQGASPERCPSFVWFLDSVAHVGHPHGILMQHSHIFVLLIHEGRTIIQLHLSRASALSNSPGPLIQIILIIFVKIRR